MPEFAKGIKFDKGKPEFIDIFQLLYLPYLEADSRVMRKGLNKYGFENWKKDLKKERIINAMLRHIVQYIQGEEIDKESNESHLNHISCNAMFLYYFDHLKNTDKK